MSYLMYNPFAPGQQNASQGQNGLFSGKTERDHWRITPSLGPESNSSYLGTSSATHASSKEKDVNPFSLPVSSNRPENNLTTLDHNSQSTFNIPIKEEIVHKSLDQCAFFTMTQNETISISAPKVSTCPVFSSSCGQQLLSTSSSSFNWLPNHKTPTEVFSKSTPNVSVCGTPAVGQRLSTEPSYFRSNSESAENILENYGLEKADLNELLNYSEEQTTAENLPYLLQTIRMKKAMRASSAVQSESNSTSQPTASTSGIDAGVSFGQAAILQDKMSSFYQPVKVAKYEHTAPCSAEVDTTVGRNITCQNTLLVNKCLTGIHSKEEQLASFTKIKNGGLGSSDDQKGSLVVVPSPRTDKTRPLQTQQNQTSGTTQSIGFGPTGMPKDKRSKIIFKPLKVFGSDDQKASVASLDPLRNALASPSSNAVEKLETQPNHTSSVPPLPLQQKNREVTSSGESKTQDQVSNVVDPMKNQQLLQKANIQTVLQILLALQPVVSSDAKPIPQSSFIPVAPDVSNAVSPSEVMSKNPVSSVSHSLPIIKTENSANVPSSKPQSSAKTESPKDLPSLAMIHDYGGFIPRRFSHTCCLCKKECAQLKDWVSHQTTNLHNANCQRLRNQYPHWDGVVPSMPRDSIRSAKTLPPTSLHHRRKNKGYSRSHSNSLSCSSSGDGGNKSSSRSRSRSYSPRRRSSSNDRRNRSSSSSPSCSPHHRSRDGKHKSSSSAHLHSSHRSTSRHRKNRSNNCSSSHSYSPSHHSSRDKRNHSNSSSCQRRLQSCISRSRSRSFSPCYDGSVRSDCQSRSRSYEKLSSPKRINKKSNSPRQNSEGLLSRGRSRERRSSTRRDRKQRSNKSLDRQASPRKTAKRLSPIRRHISQSPPTNIEDRRWSPTCGWIRRMSPRKTDDKRSSPIRHQVSQSPPRKTEDRRRSPTSGWIRRMSPRKTDNKRLSPIRRQVSQSPPRKIEDRQRSLMSGLIRRMSPRKTDNKRLSTIRRQVSQSPPGKIGDRRWSPTSGWIRLMSPRKTDDQRWSPTWNCKQQSPRRNDNRRRSPGMSYDQQSSPIRTDHKRLSQTGNRQRKSSPRGTDNKRCSPMRSHVHQSSPRNTDDRQWSPKRGSEQRSSPRRNCDRRRSPPRRTDDKHKSPKRCHEDQSSPGRPNDKQSPPTWSSEYQRRTNDNIQPLINCKIWWSPTRNDDQQWLPKKSQRQQSFPKRDEKQFLSDQSDEEMASVRRSRKRRASLEEEPSSQKKKSCSIQILTKQLLENSAVKSVGRQSNIKDVVNLVVPVLLAKLAENQDSSSPLLALPSQDKTRTALTSSSGGSKSSSSSAKIQSKLKCSQGSASRRAPSITTKRGSKPHELKARVTNEESSCKNLDHLPIRTLLSLHQKLVRKAKRLSSKGKHISRAKPHSLKTQNLKSVVLIKKPLKSRSLETRPNFCLSNPREGRILSRKDQDSEFKEKTRVKGVRRIIVAESNKGKKAVTKVKAHASKTSANEPLYKTAKYSGVAKLIKVEDSRGDKFPASNASQPKMKENNPPVRQVVTTSDPSQAQQTVIKMKVNSLKASPKVKPRKVPESKKSKTLGKNPDSGSTRDNPAAKAFKKEKDSEVAIKDTTKVGKILKTVAVPDIGKTSEDKKLDQTARCSSDGEVRKALVINSSKSINDQSNCKETETTPSMSVVTSTLPVTENRPDDSETSKPEISETKVLQSNANQSQLLSSKEKEGTSSKATNALFKLTSAENLPEICQGLKTESTEIKVAVLLEDAGQVVKTDVSTAETSKQTELTKFGCGKTTVKSTGTLKPGNTAAVVPTTVDSPETERDKVTAKPEQALPVSEVLPTPDITTDPTRTQQITIKTLVKTVWEVQPKVMPNPDLAALNPTTNGTKLEIQPASAEKTPLGALQKTGGEEEKNQKDAVHSETQKNPLPNPVSNIPVLMTRGVDSNESTSNIETIVTPNRIEASLTVGERIAYYLNLSHFDCVPAECIVSSNPFALASTLLLITNLPVQSSCTYTEEEVVNLLCKFEFQYAHDNIYVIPQTGMAFVLMPNERSVIGLILASMHGHLSFKWQNLFLHIVKKDMLMTPLGFYRSLIEPTPLSIKDNGISIIYIQNISPSDITDLRKALRRMGHVRNFLPLLNKVFVEFETVYDADRLGVWYSLMRMGFLHTVNRLKVPRSIKKSHPPKLPLKALPDGQNILPDAGIPDVKYGVPQGTTAPCWVTMMTPPYIFPTASPWFNIPNFLTVQGEDDILTTPCSSSEFFTIMLTGLPEENYKHEDVAKLVWRYFPKQNLQTLYHNILVLPLQRRAFVFFCDWKDCCSFVFDCVKKPLSVGNCTLSVHFILEEMYPGCSEETMYKSLMKWSSGYVPDLFLLEKRLLCVKMYEANVNLIKSVMEEVAAIASFVSFVPLANRICIEMVSPSCAAKVLKEMPLRKILSPYIWSKVGYVECVMDLNQRLKETSEIKINLEVETPGVIVELPASKTEAPSPLSEPRNDVADADSAVSAAFIKSAILESESKPEEKAAGPPDVVPDSKAERTPTTQECQPCEKISTVADPDKKIQTDPLSKAVRSFSDESVEASPSVKTETTAKELVKDQPAGLDSCLTAGEKIGSLLQPQNISCLGHNIIMSEKAFSLQSRLLLLTNLPQYWNDRYTECGISNLLHKFGFQYQDNNIFVIPQACMAFVLMPSYQKAREVFLAVNQGLTLCGSKLGVEIVSSGIVMIPFGFYKSVMKLINFPITDDGTSTIYIRNISPKEVQDLRESLKKIGSVKNYLPLLNKVFIEFESAADADRIGVWYSLLKRRPAHNIFRIKAPQSKATSSPPQLAAWALPESMDIVARPVVLATNGGIPEGSQAPFLISMPNAPFIFPTVSPWFIIPKFKTVDKEEDLLASISVASKFSTVMLTGLPKANCKHKDVAKLVWKYFTEQNLHTLFYNIVVLPLQRRAFVYFNDWQSCQNFVEDFLKTGDSFKGHRLHIHLVLEEMHPGSSEETMYQTLMKWSNAHVPELESLEERLVCVVLSDTSSNLMTIVKLVTTISPIVSFLPLANRLCIEMAESRGVNRVLANFAQTPEDWNKVPSVESVKSLKQRLKDSSEAKSYRELYTECIDDTTTLTESEPQAPPSNVPVESKPPVQEVTNLPTSVLVTKDLVAGGSETQEKMEIGASETKYLQPKVQKPTSEKQPDVCVKAGNKAAPEKKQQAETVKEVKSEGSAESKGGNTAVEKPSLAKATTTFKTEPSKPSTNPHQSPQTNLKPQGTSVSSLPQVQKCIKPNSDFTAQVNQAACGSRTEEKMEIGAAETKNVQSKVQKPTSEEQPDAYGKVQQSAVVPRNKNETGNKVAPEKKQKAETVEVKEVKGRKIADGKPSPATPTTTVKTEPSKASTNPQQSPQTELKPQGTSVKALPQVQKCINSSAEENQDKMEIGASETKHLQSNVQKPTSEKKTDACVKAENKVAPEKKQQAETVDVKEVKGERIAVEKPSPATPTITVKTEPSKPSTNPHQSPHTKLKPQGTPVNSPPQDQKCIKPNPNSSAEHPKTKTSDLVKTSASKVSAASVEIGQNTKSMSQPPAATSSTKASSLTPGEKLQHFLKPFQLRHLDINTILSPIMFSYNITLIVTNLPRFFDGSYTEAEIINLLQKFGFQCDDNKFFVVPQSQMAFLIMPKVREVQRFFKGPSWRNILFKGRKLEFLVKRSCSPMTWVGLYQFLMSFTGFPAWKIRDPETLLYFHNISPKEAIDLREALRNICSIINYLPLLNKAFVQCKNPADAIRLEVWYSHWKWSRSHNVQHRAPSPAAQALELWENTAVGATVPLTTGPIPEGSRAPFWITTTTSPYVDYTTSPFFKIPAFKTINTKSYTEVWEQDLYFATIMLTDLPNRTYTHEDVAMLVWKYFPEQNLHTLYNNIVVLPLQRRAFVFFSSSEACFRFLQDQKMNPVYLKGFIPKIHLLLEYINLRSSEESMFRTLMKWSNIHVPELKSLEERVLIVEVSGTNENIVMMLMKQVASIATFASFLPLANRIYIEMAESSGVIKVVENLSVCKLSEQFEAWNQVGRVESLLSRKERLKDCRKIAVNLERGTMSVHTEAKPLKRREDESATYNALPDGLIASHKGTKHPQGDLNLNTLNELKAVILQHKLERNSTLSKESSSESSSKSSSSFKQTTKEIKISHSSSATTEISKSIKDCKSSASSSGSIKSSLSSSSTPLTLKTQKQAPESTKSQTNPSSSADGSKTFPSSSNSGKSSASSAQKDESTKREIPLRASQTPFTPMGRSTCSPATSAETHQSDKHGAKPPGVAVAKADHKVSGESCTAKTQSGSRVKESDFSLPAQGQNLEFINQTPNQGCFKDKRLKETTEGKENDREMGDNVKSPIKENHDPESYQITDSVAGQKDKENYSTETPGPDKGQILCHVGLHVSENIEDKKAFNNLEGDAYFDLKDDPTKERMVVVKEETCLIKDEGSTVKPDQRTEASRGEEGETLSVKQESSDKQPEIQRMDSSTEIETGEGTEKMVCKDSVPDESPTQSSVRKTSREGKQDEANRDKVATDEPTISQSGKDAAVEEKEISIDGHAAVQERGHLVKDEGLAVKPSQKTRTSKSKDGEKLAKTQDKPPETQSKDSSAGTGARTNEMLYEDPPALNPRTEKGLQVSHGVDNEVQMCHQSGKAAAVKAKEITADGQERERLVKDEGLLVKQSQMTGVSESEDGENVSKQEESSDKRSKNQSRDSSAEMETDEGTEEMACKDSVQDKSGTKTSFSQTTRIAKQDETNEDKAATNEPIVSQSTEDAAVKEKVISTDGHPASVQEETHLVKEESLAVNSDKITKAFESEDGENSAKILSLDKPPDTQPMDSIAETSERTEEMVCKDSVQDESSTKRSLRQTTRSAKQDKTNEYKAGTTQPIITQSGKNASVEEKELSMNDHASSVKAENPSSGRRTRSSSAGVKISVEPNQLQEKEAKPTERAGVNSEDNVTTKRKSSKTGECKTEAALVLDPPAQGQKTPKSRGLQALYGVDNEVLMYSQLGKEAVIQEKENPVKDEGLALKPNQRSGVSESEDGENSTKNQESSDNQSETQPKNSSAEMGTAKKVCERSGQAQSGTKRHSTRSANQDKTNNDKSGTTEPIITQSGKDALVEEEKISMDDHASSVKAENHLVKDEGLAVKPDKMTRVLESEDRENSSKKQSSDQHPEMQRRTLERTEKMVCKESVQDKSGRKRSFREITRSANQDKTNEDKATTNEPTITTRSTSRRREIPEKDCLHGSKDKTPRRNTPARHSQQQNKEKTQKREDTTVQGITPKTYERESLEISDNVVFKKTGEEEKEAVTPKRRGRPKKTAGPTPVRKSTGGTNSESTDEQMLERCAKEEGKEKTSRDNVAGRRTRSSSAAETQPKDSSAEKKVCEGSGQDKSGTKKHSTRSANQDKTNEDKAVTEKPTVATRSTSRRIKITERNSSFKKREETPRRKRKPAPQQNNEKTEEETPQKPSEEISNDVDFRETEEEEKEALTTRKRHKKIIPPALVRKSTRGVKSYPDGQTLERLRNKQKMEFSGPKPKRSRS